jgi:hypothetical protein
MILLGLEYASDGPELSNEESTGNSLSWKENFWRAQGILKMMSQLEPRTLALLWRYFGTLLSIPSNVSKL